MRLEQEASELLEYVGIDDFPVVGRIILRGGKFCSAEIVDDIITTVGELNQVRAFLDEVEAKMDKVGE